VWVLYVGPIYMRLAQYEKIVWELGEKGCECIITTSIWWFGRPKSAIESDQIILKHWTTSLISSKKKKKIEFDHHQTNSVNNLFFWESKLLPE
jgi:hypothetical protein